VNADDESGLAAGWSSDGGMVCNDARRPGRHLGRDRRALCDSFVEAGIL